MSPGEFRRTHGAVEDWAPEDFEHYLEACADRSETAEAEETGGQE
ncbi:hypothetical protein [Streptomyces sp. TR06-5]